MAETAIFHGVRIVLPPQRVWSKHAMESSPDEFTEVHVPDSAADETMAQDEEWFNVSVDGEQRRIRFHDYGVIYAVPGLYERIFYEELECRSPKTVVGLLKQELERVGTDPTSLTALDLGAGNGIVGEELRAIGVSSIVGVDLLPEAAAAAQRDRPEVYDDYLVADLTQLSADEQRRLTERKFNCLISVAALGFDDIPPQALATAYDQVLPGGWIALTIKEDFLTTEDPSGFQKLIRQMIDEKLLDLRTHERYRHRLSSNGEPLYYVALIAVKSDDRRAAELVS
jgi:trans-aconitate methyltransferase